MRRHHRLAQFWKIQLPLILPTIGIISILTFVGNFNAFDLIYSAQGALAGPNFSTDLLGTFLYRTFFGNQLQMGDPNMGSAVATVMFLIILGGRLRLPLPRPDAASPLPVLRRAMSQARTSAHPHASPPTRSWWLYTLIALVPVIVVRHELVQDASRRSSARRWCRRLPSTFTWSATTRCSARGNFPLYFLNSFVVTVGSVFLVLLFGAMAAFALSEYRYRLNTLLGLYLAIGIMIPIRLGTVAILQIMVASGLVNTLSALILVYTAPGLPLVDLHPVASSCGRCQRRPQECRRASTA